MIRSQAVKFYDLQQINNLIYPLISTLEFGFVNIIQKHLLWGKR